MMGQASPGSEGSDTSAVTPSRLPRPYDIFNTTFSLHHVSPLFVGSGGLSSRRLQSLEQRLRDILVGDVVRGVEVGLGDDGNNAIGSAGILETVTITMVSTESVIATSTPALQITLQYENALCLCVLLPLPEAAEPVVEHGSDADRSTLHFPLLLLRMPPALKSIIVEFLSDMFDCRVSPMRLSSMDIVRSWELWARETTIPTAGQLAKDTVLTLSFCLTDSTGHHVLAETEGAMDHAPSYTDAAEVTSTPSSVPLGVKTIDIFIPNEDLRGFLEINRHRGTEPQTELGAPDGPGQLNKDTTPFTYALACYVKHHLALDMSNPAVTIARIACGGFVLAESRLKIFAGPDSSQDTRLTLHRATVRRLLGDLVVRAAG